MRARDLLQRAAYEVVTTFVPALVIVLCVNVFVAKASVTGPSMQPNLYTGYCVIADRVSYHLRPPQRGEMVIVDAPDGGAPLVKRVVGLPGELIEVRAGYVWIDGQPLAEPWVEYYGGPGYPPSTIPQGCFFIMGDNRADSLDSRAIGPVRAEAVQGRVWLIYWPLGKIRLRP